MTKRERKARYVELLRSSGLSQINFGSVFGLRSRQAQRVATGDSPVPTAINKLVGLVLKGRVTLEEVRDE